MTQMTKLEKQAPASAFDKQPLFVGAKNASNGLFSTSDNSSDFFSENSDSALSLTPISRSIS